MDLQGKLKQFQELDLMNEGFIIPVSEKSKTRLYLCWRNDDQIQCKMIGPETKCFCNHRFKQHQYLNANGKKPHCKAPKCKCKCFDYIPTHGAYDFKCLCKHSYKEHDCTTKMCTREKCKSCTGFKSTWTCSCGAKFANHVTVIETYEQRKSKGKAVNDMMRMNDELTHAIQDGSLYKPLNSNKNVVKQDPEARLNKRRESLGLIVDSQKKIEDQEEYQIEQYELAKPKK